MKEKLKDKKAITIISLVITIVLMIIIAGVGIGAVTSGSGLLDKSREIRERQITSQIKEKLELIITSKIKEKNKNGQVKESLDLNEYFQYIEESEFTQDHTIRKMESLSENSLSVLVDEQYLFVLSLSKNGKSIKIDYIGNEKDDKPYIENLRIKGITSNSIEIEFDGTFVDRYEFFIKNHTESVYQKDTNSEENPIQGKDKKEKIQYIYNGITIGESYDIKIIATNRNGVTEVEEKNIITESIGVPTIILSNSGKWEQSKTVEISTNSKYTTRYYISEIGGQTPNIGSNLGTEYTQAFAINENCIITALYFNASGQYGENGATLTVNKIDRTNPVITSALNTTGEQTNRVTATIGVSDSESGIGKIDWYYKKASESNWQLHSTDSYKTINGTETGDSTKTETHEYTGLSRNTVYNFKAIITDVAGNTTDSSGNSSTLQVAEVTINVNNTQWTNSGNKTARVSVANSNYSKVVYKINAIPGYSDGTDITSLLTYNNGTGKYEYDIQVTENCSIYVAAFDENQEYIEAPGVEITKFDKIAPTITSALNTTGEQTNRVTATIGVSDANSGIAQIEWWYKTTSGSWTKDATDVYKDIHSTEKGLSTKTQAHEYTGLSRNTAYNFKAVITDVAGNTTDSSGNSSTVQLASVTIDASSAVDANNTQWVNSGNKTARVSVANSNYSKVVYKINAIPGYNDGTDITSLLTYNNGTGKYEYNIQVTENCSIYVAAFDENQEYIEAPGVEITRFDFAQPTIGSVTGSSEKGNSGTIAVSSIVDTGGSGLAGLYFSQTNSKPSATETGWVSNTSSSYNKSVTSNGTWYVWAKDAAGNVSDGKSCTVSNVVAKVTTASIDTIEFKENAEVQAQLSYTGEARDITITSSDTSVAYIGNSYYANTNGHKFYVFSQNKGGTATITATITNYDGTVVTATQTATVYVAKVGSNYYTSIQNAINSTSSGTITLIRSLYDTQSISIASGKNITFDMNNLKIETSSGSDKTALSVSGAGTLTIKNGTLKIGNRSSSWPNALYLNISGTVNLENMTCSAGNDVCIAKIGAGTLNISSGTYSGNNCVIQCYGSGNHGTINIIGGNYSANGEGEIIGIHEGATAKFNISGGTLTGRNNGIILANQNTNTDLTITGGTFNYNGTYAVITRWSSGGNMNATITGGTFNARGYKLTNINPGKLIWDSSNVSGNYGTPTANGGVFDINVRYIKIVITKLRNNNSGCIQMSEFNFYNSSGNRFSYPSSTTITSSMEGEYDEEITCLIDNDIDTKYCSTMWKYKSYYNLNDCCTIQMDMGTNNRLNLRQYCYYNYYTANDVEGRDPVSWDIYGSNDNSTWTLLDSRSNQSITSSRKTATQKWEISF